MSVKITVDNFIGRARAIHGNRYEYDLKSFINMSQTVGIICKEHGRFNQIAGLHVNKNGCGCPTCGKFASRTNGRCTTPQFIAKAIKVHGDKYDYSKVDYKNVNTMITIGCKIHGDFYQQPSAHTNQKHGCPKCGGYKTGNKKVMTTDDFIDKAEGKWGYLYDYSITEFTDEETLFTYRCPIHGKVEQTPYSHLKSGCYHCNGKIVSYHTKDLFIKQAKKIHGDLYDYSLMEIRRMTDYVQILCPKHGSFFLQAKEHIYEKLKCPGCFKRKKKIIHRKKVKCVTQ